MNAAPRRAARIVVVLVSAGALAGAAAAERQDPATRPTSKAVLPTGVIVDRVACARDPTQTFSLYLPTAYTAERSWPLLFVFDPRGRGHVTAELFREAAEEYGWIVASSDNTRSDSGWEPNAKALAAMVPEVPARVNVDLRRVYAAGFSGTVGVAWHLGQRTGKLAGVIGVGGHLGTRALDPAGAVAFFAAVGRRDFNYLAVKADDASMAERSVVHRMEVFDGIHEWFPASIARAALGWFEAQGMRDGRRARDEALLSRLLEDERRRAEALEASGRLAEALWAYETIVRTYGGLADVHAAELRAKALRTDDRVEEAVRADRRADDWEASTRAALGPRLAQALGQEVLLPARQVASTLGVAELQTRARRAGAEGDAAGRVLESLFVETSFYRWRDLMEQRSWSRAVFTQSVALAIAPEAPLGWYRLAGSLARAGQRRKALDALRRAVEHGFRNVEALSANQDLESLKGDPEFVALTERLRQGS